MPTKLPTLTELDAARIRTLGSRLPDQGRGLAALVDLIDLMEAADIVPGARVPADVVTVNSTLSFRDVDTDTLHRVTLVYPVDVSIGERRISILSPVGRALLGRRVGERVRLEMPGGGTRELAITELHYQPEASGDFTR